LEKVFRKDKTKSGGGKKDLFKTSPSVGIGVAAKTEKKCSFECELLSSSGPKKKKKNLWPTSHIGKETKKKKKMGRILSSAGGGT